MGRIRSIARELAGLFVDDGSFAIAILVWLIVIFILARVIADARWLGIALFAGLAIILIENVLRFARRRLPR